MRKEAQGPVDLRVVVDGVADATLHDPQRRRLGASRLDTAARAGQIAAVRFEITSPAPRARHFAFAAEARSEDASLQVPSRRAASTG